MNDELHQKIQEAYRSLPKSQKGPLGKGGTNTSTGRVIKILRQKHGVEITADQVFKSHLRVDQEREMSKVKKAPPQKKCVSCGKEIHAATRKCKFCEAEQPMKERTGGKGKGKKAVSAETVATFIDTFGHGKPDKALELLEALGSYDPKAIATAIKNEQAALEIVGDKALSSAQKLLKLRELL